MAKLSENLGVSTAELSSEDVGGLSQVKGDSRRDLIKRMLVAGVFLGAPEEGKALTFDGLDYSGDVIVIGGKVRADGPLTISHPSGDEFTINSLVVGNDTSGPNAEQGFNFNGSHYGLDEDESTLEVVNLISPTPEKSSYTLTPDTTPHFGILDDDLLQIGGSDFTPPSSIPLPPSIALQLAGLGLGAVALRRKKKNPEDSGDKE